MFSQSCQLNSNISQILVKFYTIKVNVWLYLVEKKALSKMKSMVSIEMLPTVLKNNMDSMLYLHVCIFFLW